MSASGGPRALRHKEQMVQSLNKISERLLNSAHPFGGWSYGSGMPVAAEATAFACIALNDDVFAVANRGLQCLADMQRADGGVPVYDGLDMPCWPTAHAVLAWLNSPRSSTYKNNVDRAINWLVHSEGKSFRSDPKVYGHDTMLKGWPWVDGTHSWLEPTAFAVLALCAAGLREHSRTREGVALILDRAISESGWNYGNPRMFGADLRPFPASTGIALAALAGQPANRSIHGGLDYLRSELPQIRSPLSLCWGVIALTLWNQRPEAADSWLEDCAKEMDDRPINCAHDALIVLASRAEISFSPRHADRSGHAPCIRHVERSEASWIQLT